MSGGAPAGPPGPLLVMGAGSIGCFVGGRLQAAGATVHFVGRPRVIGALAGHGLELTDLEAPPVRLDASALWLHGSPPAQPVPSLALLCVKSGGTADAARQLAAVLPPGTPVTVCVVAPLLHK